MKNKRLTWLQYFMSMANLATQRSTCIRRQVGAVLVRDNHILATGYNGAPKGITHCVDTEDCIRQLLDVPSGERHELCRAVHAEQNAIVQAACNGTSIKGATLYTTTYPCSICTKMLINAGIKEVIYDGEYPDPTSEEYFREAEIPVRTYH